MKEAPEHRHLNRNTPEPLYDDDENGIINEYIDGCGCSACKFLSAAFAEARKRFSVRADDRNTEK